MKNISLYIHIPFCVGKCIYCDFVSEAADNERISRYVDALIAEIRIRAPKFKNRTVNTLFVGGGTPSRMQCGELTRIIDAVNQHFNLNIEEFTTEANPVTLDIAHANEYAALGVNRISIGVQTLDSRVAKALRRSASPADALAAIKLATSRFENVNTDIMLGLPYQTMTAVANTLNGLMRERVTHISAYGLILSEKTPLYDMVKSDKISLPNEDEAADMYELAADILISNGYDRYEISNFALKGCECKHNLVYWRRGDYIGLGTAAHSLIGNIRTANSENIENYISMLNEGILPVAERTVLKIAEEKEEAIMLALRCAKGLDIARFNKEFDTDFVKEYQAKIEKIKSFVELNDNWIRILPKHFYISNSIIAELI